MGMLLSEKETKAMLNRYADKQAKNLAWLDELESEAGFKRRLPWELIALFVSMMIATVAWW